jgi:hypothetical protein
MLTASGITASESTQVLRVKENLADKSSTSAERPPGPGIPCNWTGWKNSFPEVKCGHNRCDKKREVLRIKCLDGFVTEVKTARVCAGCMEF